MTLNSTSSRQITVNLYRYQIIHLFIRRGRSRRREPQQSNHDVCVVPEEVSAHEGKPLYVLVALW
ncbi:CaiF/GrlA family transcriptional regulator, partial [Salmonella enterica subsp. enterica serovar Cotham]|nr:CaiF/GrlA family transcriptional regulator [Salmonella enterica subsp. enterica serovar Cotham]